MSKASKLEKWQETARREETAYCGELAKMDGREQLYRGDKTITQIVAGDKKTATTHVRNIIAEAIEGQVDSNIPAPKVTARRREDEGLAKLIEDMILNELDRLPVESINDIQERTVPMQGGSIYLVEWDNTLRTHNTVGELVLSAIHPKQVIPQDGVYTGIEDMDHIIIKLPQTKEYIRRRYHVEVEDENESDPDIKSADNASAAEDLVTQYVAYYRNCKGGIGLYSWVNDTELEDLEEYQARRLRRCKKCGAVEPVGEDIGVPTFDGSKPGDAAGYTEASLAGMDGAFGQRAPAYLPGRGGKKYCPCGSCEWKDSVEEYEEIYTPIQTRGGLTIPGAQTVWKETGETDALGLPVMAAVEEPTRIPYYKPGIYPVILQKNVSLFGNFLGDSDVDKIASQQNTTNRIESKIIDKLLGGGSYISVPNDVRIETGPEDMKVLRLSNAADKALIDVYDLQGDVESDLYYLNQLYEESRQIIGLTDSYQGRKDRTATSGVAKQFSAAQAAGRLESKRRMKDAAYATLFEAIFKFKLAYTDEKRPVVSANARGRTTYDIFNRYDFLLQDEAGDYYWNDQFLFSCDSAAPLANNREAMWQETRSNFESGGFGNRTDINTLIQYWTKMEQLHYPGAADTKAYLEERGKAQVKAARAAQTEVNSMLANERQQNQQTALGGQVAGQAAADAQAAVAALGGSGDGQVGVDPTILDASGGVAGQIAGQG